MARRESSVNRLVGKRDEIRAAIADRRGMGSLQTLSSPQIADIDRETDDAIARCRSGIKRENTYPNAADLTPFERLLVDYCRLEREENGSIEGDASEGFGARH
jgi:hypothetical protein